MTPLSRFVLRTLPLCALLVPGLVSAESATPAAAPKTTAAPKPAASKATSSPEKVASKAEKTPKPATADKTDKSASDAATSDKKSAPKGADIGGMGNMFGAGQEFDLKTGPKGTLSTTMKDNLLQKLVAKDPDGKVVVTNPQFKLVCETLTYVESAKQAIALGNPVQVDQPTAKATCKKLEMYPGDNDSKFVLTGDPVIQQAGQGRASGDKITIIQHKDGTIDTFIDAPHVVSTGNKAATPTVPTTVVKQPTATPSGGATIEIDTTQGGLKDGGISLPGMKSTAAPAPKSNQP